ncbi:alpha/beta fold hydrolase [Nocardia amamiensis]|uniref:alpha/beta fold hydrolase n=1 Tax=Nocardia amamiensis TaxID=404578 RepID=UPI000830538F|nr:alpha/beta hydrolase [Nocardia amamiensis]
MSIRSTQTSSRPLRPFQQQPFSQVPEQPTRPHLYYQSAPYDLEMESTGLGRLRIHYRAYGSGEPLLLVHGLMTSSYSWRYVLEGLGAHYQLIMPDLPGNGRSSAPAVRLSAPKLAAWIGEFQAALGLRGCLAVGNSLGGYLVMRQALADPGAFTRLVNIHAPVFPQLRLHALHTVLSVPGAEDVLGWWIRRDTDRWAHRIVHYYDDTLKSLEESREYGGPLKAVEGTRAFTSYLRDVMRPADHAEFIAALERLERDGKPFPMPIQLIYSRLDPLVSPSVGERLAALIPDAQLNWVDRSSHFAQVDSPAEVTALILGFMGADQSR